MNQSIQIVCAFIFGVVFIITMLVIAILIPYPSDFQLLVFRVTLALAAGGIAAMIPGFLEFEIPNYVRAGGAIAAFAIIYFINPAIYTTEGIPTSTEGVFLKKSNHDDGFEDYYWKQSDIMFRLPKDNWTVTTKAAESGLGDMTLEHNSSKDAQIQFHISLLDEKYKDNWDGFKDNTVNTWKKMLKNFGMPTSEEFYIDGRPSFSISGEIPGQVEGFKDINLLYVPIGDNRLFEMHLTRNKNHPDEDELFKVFELIKSTIKFSRE